LLEQTCPRCGRKVPDPVDNCTHCGKKIESGRTERENPSRVEGCLTVFVGLALLPVSGTLVVLTVSNLI
jgi:uncharacterized OB-fold protein